MKPKTTTLPLVDGSGGLNNFKLPGALQANEWSKLENCYTDEGGLLRQVPGADIIQDTPIAPTPYISDANTLALWHLDEAAAPFADSSPNAHTLTEAGNVNTVEVDGVFANARKFVPATQALPFGGFLYTNTAVLNGLTEISVEAWIKLDPSFSGRPVLIDRFGSAVDVGNDGGGIVSTFAGLTRCFELTAHRDWDAENGVDIGNPYLKFSVQLAGVLGLRHVLTSPGMTMGAKIHLRAEYSSVTGYACLYVNGSLVDKETPVGGGVLYSPVDQLLLVGGRFDDTAVSAKVFNGVIDEVRISTVARGALDFPFKKPRPTAGILEKSDGVNQLVVPAGDGLYYTVGDGNYSLIRVGLSLTAKWVWQQMGDILYGCNGEDGPLAWDGLRWVPWFEGVTPLTTQAAVLGAVPVAGVYKYLYTFGYGGEETGPSPINTLNLGVNSNVAITDIPTRHSNASTIQIYRTKTGGSTFYLLRVLDNDPNVNSLSMTGPYASNGSPSTDSGSDGVPDATLGTGEYAEISAEVLATHGFNARYTVVNFDRVFLAGMDDQPYEAGWTEPGLPDIRLSTSFVTSAHNRRLTGLSKSQGEIQAHKDGRGCLVLRGSEPSNWRQFDDLHPSLGAIDHFSIVYRTISRPADGGLQAEDVTEVCMLTPEGWYGYQGYEFYRIDEPINGTFQTLVQANSTLLDYITTSQAQFQAAALAGGGATSNIQASRYETDGLREVAGSVRVVDQLDYLGLWPSAAALVAGNVISVVKGVNEGEFYFATDAANTLWWTGDNFQTVTAIAGSTLAATERIIQIVRRATDDFYFLITDSANADPTNLSSAGGNVYTVNDPRGTGGIGPAWTTLTAAPLFYDLDVPMRMEGGPGPQNGRTIGPGFPASTSPNNIFINHQQKVFTIALCDISGDVNAFQQLYNSASVGSGPSGLIFQVQLTSSNNQRTTDLSPAFYFYSTKIIFRGNSFRFDNSSLSIDYTRREFPRWRGGTFGPQAYWDATNSRLLFLASTAEDGSGNRSTYIRTLTSAGALLNQYTANNVGAFTTDGATVWFTISVNPGPGQASGQNGTAAYILKSTVANPGGVTFAGPILHQVLFTRLSYNPQSGLFYLANQKIFNVGLQDFWTYQASVQKIDFATNTTATLRSFAPSGDSGTLAGEFSIQTTTPYSWFAAPSKISVADPAGMYEVSPALLFTTFKGAAYQSQFGSAPVTGILSNLLFVPSSDVAGGNLWADRLYWSGSAAASADARFIQLGVPGSWTVLGTFTGALVNLGVFSAFGDFGVQYQGNIAFSLANGAAGPFVPADFVPVAPNQRITTGSAPGAFVQWSTVLTWAYTVAAPSDSPSFNFIDIGYFLGDNNIPATAAVHHNGRTRWAVAVNGSDFNNMEVIYQKNSRWTTCPQRNIVTYAIFRSQLVAFVDYTLVHMDSGPTWLGAPVVPRAVGGYIMGTAQDKFIRNLKANVMQYLNQQFPTQRGWFMVRAIAGGVPIPGSEWYVPIPATAGPEVFPMQVSGDMLAFSQKWARAMALEITVSDDLVNFPPASGQTLDLQELILDLRSSNPRNSIPVT